MHAARWRPRRTCFELALSPKGSTLPAGRFDSQGSGRSEHVREGAEQIQKRVQEHPTQSMLACLGIGIITGVVVGTVLRHD